MNAVNISTFEIRTPADDGNYHLLLDGKEVTAQTLKYGVVKLFNELGIIPGGTQGVEFQLINIIKRCPDSREKVLLLNILDSSQFNNLPPLPPEPPQKAQNQQDVADTPVITDPPEQIVVTDIQTPGTAIKPPYHKHGQLTIFDADIKRAIQEALANGKTARERSYRTIADLLKFRGILVSHMTISRRIKELTK